MTKLIIGLVALLLACGCGAKIDSRSGALGGDHGKDGVGDDAGKDASSSAEGGLATEVGAGDTSGGPTATDAAIGPCNPAGRGALIGGGFVSMNWQADECQPDASCIQVVHADGCHLNVQTGGAVFKHDMTAADCALLGDWMNSVELISAVKRGYTCKYERGNLDILQVNDVGASTSYKVPPNCTDEAWVDHRACMQYVIDTYGH